MADIPDTSRGGFVRDLLRFLGSPAGAILVAVVVVSVVTTATWDKIVVLIHGPQKTAPVADNKPTDPPVRPPGLDPKIGPRSDEKTKPDSVVVPPVVPVDAAPQVKPRSKTLAFGAGELTSKVVLDVTDENPAGVKVTAVSLDPGLLPSAGVRVAEVPGTANARVLSVNPNPNEWGNGRIRVTATDAAGQPGEAVIDVTVPAPALSIQKIDSISVAYSDPIPIVRVTVTDAARNPPPVRITATVTDGALFTPDGVTFDPDKKTLKLTPRSKASGMATVKVTADTGDTRTATQTFTVTVAPKPPTPLTAGGKAKLKVGVLHVDTDERGSNTVFGSELDKETEVVVEEVKGKRCRIKCAVNGRTVAGWLDAANLAAVEDE